MQTRPLSTDVLLSMARDFKAISLEIPDFVAFILRRLQNKGHEAYVVGGVVRDALIGRSYGDWDITTSAVPSEIEAIFGDIRHYRIKHNTVTLVQGAQQVEVTTFRGQDAPSLIQDLRRRDFTINAMAYCPRTHELIDPFGGRQDLSRKAIRAVEDPEARFREDPIRLLRAVRLATELHFHLEQQTINVLTKRGPDIRGAAPERIREELMKILMVPFPSRGFYLMRRTGLLNFIIPELLEGYLKRQNQHHHYTIFRHIMITVDTVPPTELLRLTALFHDIAKPRVRAKDRGQWRFLRHEQEGARLTEEIMARLRFRSELTQRVSHLVRHHMIGYSPQWTDSAVRRLIQRVGPEAIHDLLLFRKADLLAHGKGDEQMELLDELKGRVETILNQGKLVACTRDLAINGHTVMRVLKIPPGPRVGKVLNHLMQLVTEHPELNTQEQLVQHLQEIKIKE